MNGHFPDNIDSKYHTMSKFSGFSSCQLIMINPALNRRRVYFIEIVQGLFDVILFRAWGRIGNRVRCKEEWYVKIEDAIKEANRLYREKVRKGYKEIDVEGSKLFEIDNVGKT